MSSSTVTPPRLRQATNKLKALAGCGRYPGALIDATTFNMHANEFMGLLCILQNLHQYGGWHNLSLRLATFDVEAKRLRNGGGFMTSQGLSTQAPVVPRDSLVALPATFASRRWKSSAPR